MSDTLLSFSFLIRTAAGKYLLDKKISMGCLLSNVAKIRFCMLV